MWVYIYNIIYKKMSSNARGELSEVLSRGISEWRDSIQMARAIYESWFLINLSYLLNEFLFLHTYFQIPTYKDMKALKNIS